MKLVEKKYQINDILWSPKKNTDTISLLSQGTVQVIPIKPSKHAYHGKLPVYSSQNQSLAPGLIATLLKKKFSLSYQTDTALSVSLVDLKMHSLPEICEQSKEMGALLTYALFQEYVIILKTIEHKTALINLCKKIFCGLSMGISQAYKILHESWSHQPSETMKKLLKNPAIEKELEETNQINREAWYEQIFCPYPETRSNLQFDEKEFQELWHSVIEEPKQMTSAPSSAGNQHWELMHSMVPSLLKSLEALLILQQEQDEWFHLIWGGNTDSGLSLNSHLESLQKLGDKETSGSKSIEIIFSMSKKQFIRIKTAFDEFHFQPFPFQIDPGAISANVDVPTAIADDDPHLQKKARKGIKETVTKFFSQFQSPAPATLQSKKQIPRQPKTRKIETILAGKEPSVATSPQKIFDILEIHLDIQQECIRTLDALYKGKDESKNSAKNKKLRKQMTEIYWKIWETGFKYWHNSETSPPEFLAWFLFLGIFDERWITKNHMKQIVNLPLHIDRKTNQVTDDSNENPSPSAYSVIDWLKIIYHRKEENSWNTSGETLLDTLNIARNPQDQWKNLKAVPEGSISSNTFIEFEIRNFVRHAAALTTAKPLGTLPFFTSEGLGSNLSNHYIDEQKLENLLQELSSIDFSMFYRSVVYHNPALQINAEFIQNQIRPYFVFLPIVGNKGFLWQELGNRSKNSRGRIAIPRFCQGEIRQLLIEIIGSYRWELTKVLMGTDWNNIGVPSITSLYTDYIQFIRKNKNLSQEAKKKAQMEFKKYRADKDRFVNDYRHWINSEAKGIPKLNKVVREIFYYQVPFAASIRKKIKVNPIYDRLDNRLTNLRFKKYNRLSVRYRNRQPLPRELKENLNYYKM